MNGVLRCARYAFSPNKLKYCGPDRNSELFSYISKRISDQGLVELLDDFKVMYPYLKLIADENGIKDVFDERVVEAYWIGNNLLDGVSIRGFWDELMERQKLKDKFKPKDLKWITGKVPKGAKVHHSYHVMNVWNRTGHEAKPHTVETMDNCRISWGKIISVGRDKIKVKGQKLEYKSGKLMLKKGGVKEISWRVGDKKMVRELKTGDLVTVHWGWVCEKVNKFQVRNLEFYTKRHIKLANETI